MKKRLNILVVTPTFLPIVGGAELGIHEIYSRIAKTHNVTILTPYQSNELLGYYSSNGDYKTDAYDVVHYKDPFRKVKPVQLKNILSVSSLPCIRALMKLKGHTKFDVSNFHYISPHGLASLFLSRSNGIPIALSLVGRSDVWKDYSFLQRNYAKPVLANAQTIISITNYCLEGYTERDDNVQIIPYGVNTRDFSPKKRSVAIRRKLGIEADGFLIFTVQRLTKVKRVDVLIEMMTDVVDAQPNAVLAIGGQGEEYDRLTQLIEELNLQKNVKLIGYIPEQDLPIYFASSDIFAFHSTSETFGVVFAQAMASGLPIVSIKSTCIPEVVRKEKNGILVDPFDVKGLSDAIIRLINDKKLYRSISNNNRERALKDFNWDNIAKRYEKVLLELAESGH